MALWAASFSRERDRRKSEPERELVEADSNPLARRHHADVGRERKHAPTRDRVTVHPGDDRRRVLVRRPDEILEGLEERGHSRRVQVRDLLQVEPGRKRVTFAAEEDWLSFEARTSASTCCITPVDSAFFPGPERMRFS
jgi:hypothetical protein